MDGEILYFKTKKELLIYLGKNPKDNKLIDRMMLRGEVMKEDGMYCMMEKKETALIREVYELRRNVQRLEAENARLLNECDMLSIQRPVELHEEVKYLDGGSDLDFQIQENERLEGEKEILKKGIINAFRYFSRGTSWEIFKDKLDVGDLLDDIEIE